MTWQWNVTDETRFERSKKEKPESISGETAVFAGSHGTYHATLSTCDCPDFRNNLKGQQPCKHILALGAALGAYDVDAVAKRFVLWRVRERLACAYGFYYLYDHALMSDAEYDALKAESERLTSDLNGMKMSDTVSPDELKRRLDAE